MVPTSQLVTLLMSSECRVLDDNDRVSFSYKPEPRPLFPQHFNQPITPEEIGVKLVSCRANLLDSDAMFWRVLESLYRNVISYPLARESPPSPTQPDTSPKRVEMPGYLWEVF